MVLFCSNEKFFINILVQKYKFGRKRQKGISTFLLILHTQKSFIIKKCFFFLIIMAISD